MTRTVYSSDMLVGNRRTAWRGVISNLYAHLDIDIEPKENFSARICRRIIGETELTEVAADSEHARRTPRHIARALSDSCIYLLVRRGHLSVAQFGRECTIGPGEFTLLHLDHPYLFSHAERVEKIGLKMPTHLLRLREATLAQQCAVPRTATNGIARLAASYVSGLCGEDLSPDDAASHSLSRIATDLLCLSYESIDATALPDETAVRAALRRRCEAYLAANCSDGDLDPAGIASAMGISVRYLHQCFEPTGTTVMQTLKEQRLARCFADLSDRRCKLSIAEIAVRNGFRNVSHFNEAFRAQYGTTPREARVAP